ncbi:MAG: hypothetical protein AB1796_05565 [Bacillota bacterium]
MLKLGNIIGRCFDAQDDPEPVVHLDAGYTHLVLNPCALDTGIEIVTHFALVTGVKLFPQESGDILRLNGVDGRTNQVFIQRLKISLFAENNICAVFGLHDAPAVRKAIFLDHGAVPLGKYI